MELNCLTYLLNLWEQGNRFTIFYCGDHCIGVTKEGILDFGNFNWQEQTVHMMPIEKWHNKKTVSKIFNLSKEQNELLKQYYNDRNSRTT